MLRFLIPLVIAFSFDTVFHVGFAQEASYTVNPGDRLRVSVWRETDMDREIVVPPDGTISFPLAGSVVVEDKTPPQIEDELTERLSNKIRAPQVSVSIVDVEGNRAYLLGQVNQPGSYILNARMRVAQLISMGGGLTEFARSRRIVILREGPGGTQRINVDIDAILKGRDAEGDVRLEAGDVVYVP